MDVYEAISARKTIRDFEPREISVTRKVCRIPDYYERVCIVPVGVPDGVKGSPPKKRSADEPVLAIS